MFSEASPVAEGEEVTAEATQAAEEEVPAEVEAMDGIESNEEAHNSDRPARESLKKKRARKGTALSEFEVGASVKASVRTITNYGAFLDFGATTDGLLHISNLSTEFVSDVNEVLKVGQEIEVRIATIDAEKNQVGLSLLTEEEEADAKENARAQARQRGGGGRSNNSSNDAAVAASLADKGFDPDQFVTGKVVSTVDFGAFVRIDASTLNSEATGEMDGLVHISALSTGRVDSVSSVVKEGDEVQVRVKSITGRKVGLSMVSAEDEQKSRQNSFSGKNDGPVGALDWKERLEEKQAEMPKFFNGPAVVDKRK